MKKYLSAILAFILITALLAGCGEKAPQAPNLNGVALNKYAIVYSDADTDYAQRAAQYIRDQIHARYSLELPLQEDSAVTSEYEIVVGDTEREISALLDVDTGANSFSLMATEKQIGLEGDYFFIAAAAYCFVETYIAGGEALPGEATLCTPITKAPKNYILLIGDGMGFNHTKLYDAPPAESGYSDGEDIFYGYLLPYQGMARTDSLDGLTDSAAAGTALATGYKTHNGYLGLLKDGTPVKSLTELGNELGMATAIMSTESSTGATPSAFLVHAPDRDDKTVITNGQNVIEQAGTVICCSFDTYEPVLVQKRVEGEVTKTLNTLKEDPDGFFLMYEEAHIDKQSHKNDLERTYLAVVRFNQVIGLMMEFCFYNPDTFLLITADHETGDLRPEENGAMAFHLDIHTNQDVPVFAYGQGSEVFDGITVENTQISKTIAKMWGVTDFGDPATAPALP